MLPVVQKFLGRVFAHREQECPSAKGSFFGKVNKSRKAGIHESPIPSTEPVSAYPEPVFSRGRLPNPLPWPLAPPITTNDESCREPRSSSPPARYSSHQPQPMQPAITEEGPSITEEGPQSPNTCTIPTIPLSRWPPRTRRPTQGTVH
jgi:hypothetical protein